MLPTFAHHLRLNTKLRIINTIFESVNTGDLKLFERLEVIEQTGQISGYVSSMVHGTEELLTARLTHHWVQISDKAIPHRFFPQREARSETKAALIPDGSAICCLGRTSKGQAVRIPLSCSLAAVLGLSRHHGSAGCDEAMQEAEIGIVDWDRRGVVVGEDAWAVLSRWYETLQVENLDE
jgi:hypothetical protein